MSILYSLIGLVYFKAKYETDVLRYLWVARLVLLEVVGVILFLSKGMSDVDLIAYSLVYKL